MPSYDLPSWMQAEGPSEPWKALVSGAQAGSQIGSNILRSRALSEERRQFDIQQERLAQFDEVKSRLFEQEYQLGEIKVKTALRNREEQIAAEGAYSKVAKLMSDHSLAGIAGTDASEARIWSTIANNPQFYLHPASKDFLSKMQISREAREKASEREELELTRLAIIEQGRIERAAVSADTSKDVAETRADAVIEAAKINAKSRVDTALVAASKWKDHSRFAAFKDASAAIKLQIDPVKEPEKYAEAVRDIYNKLLPSGEPNAWDTGSVPPLAPMPSPSKFEWTPEGIKKKN